MERFASGVDSGAKARAAVRIADNEHALIAENTLSIILISMHNEFTALIEPDGEWFVAYCPEVPEANGQGKTPDEAKQNLAEAIALVLEDRREDALRQASATIQREMVTVVA